MRKISGRKRTAAPATRILVVEDSPTQAEVLRRLLEGQGYAAAVAASGEDALAGLRRERADLVLTDVLMPGMDGFAVCRAVKSDPALKDIPVVLLTSLSSPEDVIRGLQCGADSFIRKPSDDQYLLSRVRYLLANREVRRSEKLDVGLDVGLELHVGGEKHIITSDRRQILDLLISTYEEAVRLNRDLERRQVELERSHRILDGLYAVALGLNGATTEATVAETAIQRALELPGVQSAWIVLREGSDFRVAAAGGLPPALEAPSVWEGDCRCRRMLRSGELGRDASVVECERLQRARSDTHGLRYHATVPLWVGGRTIGVMNLVSAEAGIFTADDLRVLRTVGNQVGISLERAGLYERMEQLVAERTAALTAEVAERLRAEEGLRESEERFRALVEQSLVGIYVIRDGRLAYVNPKFAEIFGYAPGEIAELYLLTALDVVAEEDRPLVAENIRRRSAGEVTSVHYTFRGRRKDGTVIQVEAHGGTTNFEGRPAILGSLLDITERRRTEAERERLTAILDATPDFVGIADPEGRAVYINRGGRELIGMGEGDDITGFPIRESHPEWARRRLAEEAIPAATRDGVWGGESALLGRDGREIPVWQTLLAHRAPDGTVDFFSTIAHDLSQRKRLEEQMRLAQKMEAVATLAGGVAHDFNNLLTAMRANADFALMDLPTESPVRENVQEIVDAVDRAAALTRQLLAFGRKQVLEPRPVEFNALLTDFATMLRRILGEDVALVMRLTPDPATVVADPGQLEQVVMNLCVNARDAMPKGGELALLTDRVVIDEEFCATHPWARPGDYVRLTVSDTGAGMDEATRARIFEPFFTTKELGRGTGLGLAVVYGVVKQHAGLIHVYSEPGRGTTFKIYLPFSAEAAEAQAPEAATALAGGTETILLAEDDDALRRTATRLLERLGYRVIPVANGHEALETLRARGGAIQLAMLDVVMPQLGGPAVFERIQGRFPGLRVLFMTGYSPGTSPFAPVNALPAPVLPKPYGVRALAQAVRSALEP
jgi:PAS domain S-box-containing protein